MNLTSQTALQGVAQTLHERIAPAVKDGFVSETARLAGMLLTLNANWVDDAAAIRVAENASIRSFFAEVAIGDDSGLGLALAEAAGSSDPGLRISELDIENNRLRGLLLRFHAHADSRAEASATALSQRIWRLLEQFEAARAPRG